MSPTTLVETHARQRQQADRHAKGYPFVTISRQAGAGGRTLAREILRQAEQHALLPDLFRGWQIVDQNLCEAMLRDKKLVNVSLQELQTEEYNSAFEEFMVELIGQRTSQFEVHRRLFALMRGLATVGKVVLIGRGGVCVTRKLPGGIHVRLTAPRDVRVSRMATCFGLDPKEADEETRRQDASRARMLKQIFGADVNDPSLYDAVFDTQTTAIETIARECITRIENVARTLGRV